MGDKTAIQWTDKTWNPWVGCLKVSQGCKHCYMYREQKRYDHNADPRMVRRTKTTFTDPLHWHDPALVFTCSWSDFFIEEADDWRDEAWDIIRRTPHLTYQVLTKRPERIAEHLPADWGEGYPNVWLGVSVESQEYIERVIDLSYIPCAVRFVSAEPLLGQIDFTTPRYYKAPLISMVDWLIIGGESGPDARPMNPEWAKYLIHQFTWTDTAIFFKQMGGNSKIDGHWGGNLLDGKLYQEWPKAARIAAQAARPAPPSQLSLF